MKTIDEKIKKWIKSIEKEIPVIVEKKFLQTLNKISQTKAASEKRFKTAYKIAIAAAACLVLALWILFPLFHQTPVQAKAEFMVQSARIEGQAAHTYIFKEKDPELTIVWVEK